MNNVAGIDVSKGKSMVSVLRPFGEVVAKPFSVGHTGSELKELADYLKSLDGETRVVMEHTGRYYEPVTSLIYIVWDITHFVRDRGMRGVTKKSFRRSEVHPMSTSL